jgi:hypothetical protein
MAFRSDCNKRRAMLVFVVTKSTSYCSELPSDRHFVQGTPWLRAGAVHLPYHSESRPFYMKVAAGAKAQFSFRLLRPD